MVGFVRGLLAGSTVVSGLVAPAVAGHSDERVRKAHACIMANEARNSLASREQRHALLLRDMQQARTQQTPDGKAKVREIGALLMDLQDGRDTVAEEAEQLVRDACGETR